MNISVITNFGCQTNCWYCVWKDHPLKNVSLETDWDKLETFLTEHADKGKVSVSGGGDCLYKYDIYKPWWDKFFSITDKLSMLVDVHSREVFKNDEFWKRVNRVVVSSDVFYKDENYFIYLVGMTKLRIVHVVTADSTIENIKEYFHFKSMAEIFTPEADVQFTMKQLVGYDDGGNYKLFKKKFPNQFALDAGDYNIYYMPDNTITDKFLMGEIYESNMEVQNYKWVSNCNSSKRNKNSML